MIRLVFASLAVLVVLFGCQSEPENRGFIEYVAQHPYWIQDSIDWELPPRELYEHPTFACAGGTRILRLDTAGEYNFKMINPYELYHVFAQQDTLQIGPAGFNKWRGRWRSGGDSLELTFAVYYRDIPVSVETSPGVFVPEKIPGNDTTVTAIIRRSDSGRYVIEAFGRRFTLHDAWTTRSVGFLEPRVEPKEE